MRALAIALLALAGAGFAWYHLAPSPGASGDDGAPAVPGHYGAQLHERAFDRYRLSCLMLTPLEREWVPSYTPDGFELRTQAAGRIEAYREALGAPPEAFRQAWDELGEGRGPLRALVKRYEREDLPGRCVTVIATFYTVPDPYIGGRYHGQKDGLLFEIRKTHQFADGAARLVEASVEAHDPVEPGPMRAPLADFVDGAPPADQREIEHFDTLGGGRRRAFYWVDRSWGRGPPDEAAWRIVTEATRRRPRPETETGPLDGSETRALKAFAERA